MDVRRLAAIDMWGTAGTIRRRRIVLAEFAVGVVALLGISIWLVIVGGRPVQMVIGVVFIGIGLNYALLLWHAVDLTPGDRLERELDGVDKRAELRRCGLLQLWLFVPCSLVFWSIQRRPM